MYTAKKRLYTNAAGELVDEGDPSAAFLLAPEGGRLSQDIADKYSLSDEQEAAPVAAPKDAKAEPAPAKPAGSTK